MKAFFSNPHQPKQKEIVKFYCIGDEGASKKQLYRQLKAKQPEDEQILESVIIQKNQHSFIELYDFPTDKMLRTPLQLYCNILPYPNLILYILNSDATPKDIREWVHLFKQTHLSSKLVFISDATTYHQRQRIITKVGKEFQANILENICFVSLDPNYLQKILTNLGTAGIKLATAICLRPTLKEKIYQTCRNISRIVRKLLKKWFGNNNHPPESVV